MNLKYKTRGNSSPQGKNKIFITGMPEDFELYFDEVSNQMLEYQNCAIWYNEKGLIKWDEETQEILGQMQLFVVIVTKKYLELCMAQGEALCFFAEKVHIPVLPIVYDQNVNEAYESVFRNMHYLSPVLNEVYETDISYEKKLETYMEKILTGETEREYVKKAFDAHVFMSYRKKDRAYALDLMKKIHARKCFQNIAIWYDEFLIPGDDFVEGIDENLYASDLFLMVVTPHLLEPDNYVVKVEYKAALESRKDILPVEMVFTEKEELHSLFGGIPNCVSIENWDVFEKCLWERLGHTLSSVEDMSPEKNYYIGLAYLDGIQVEVDTDRALALIQRSAEYGYIDAFDKLVTMYREGKGVTRDFVTSVEWQKRLIMELQRQFVARPTRFFRNRLYIALFELIEVYEAAGCLGEAEVYVREMEKLIAGNEKEDLILYSRVQMKYANLEAERGHLEKARQHYENSLNVRKLRLKSLTDTYEILDEWYGISAIYIAQGKLEEKAQNFPLAQDHYANAADIRYQLVQKSAPGSQLNLDYRRAYAVVLYHLGSVALTASFYGCCSKEDGIRAARKFYLNSLNERVALYEEVKTLQSEDDLLTAYLSLCNLALSYGAFIEEIELYLNNAEYLVTDLDRKRGTRRDRERRARVSMLQGQYYSKKFDEALQCNDVSEAIQFMKTAFWNLEEAYKITRELLREKWLIRDAEFLSEQCKMLGNLGINPKPTYSAMTWFEESCKIQKEIIERQGNVSQEIYISRWVNLANAYWEMGQLDKSERRLGYLDESAKIWQMLSEQFPDRIDFCENTLTVLGYKIKILSQGK